MGEVTRQRKTWRLLYRAGRLLILSYLTVTLFACTMADRMLFQAPPASYGKSADDLVRFGPGQKFAGFYTAPTRESGPILLWSHGNAEDAGQIKELLPDLQARGIGVLFYDYPGYGLSSGEVSENGTYEAAAAAWTFLQQEKGHSPSTIFLLGQSVGSGPACYLAERKEAAGLILISPFKSAFRVITRIKILPWDRFDNWKRMSRINTPLLLVHGENDEVISFAHGQALFQRHEGQKTFLPLPQVGHNDLWSQASDEVFDTIATWITSGPVS